MKIKDGYVLRSIADTNIVVPIGDRISEFNGIITLNDISSKIWEHMQEDRTFDELLAYILSIYDVEEETAKGDLKNLIERMESSGVIEQ